MMIYIYKKLWHILQFWITLIRITLIRISYNFGINFQIFPPINKKLAKFRKSTVPHCNLGPLKARPKLTMAWTNPQPAIVWASSSSVYGLNTKVPFSEKDRTDQPASLYAASKKAGEEIVHLQSYLRTFPYWLRITGLLLGILPTLMIL